MCIRDSLYALSQWTIFQVWDRECAKSRVPGVYIALLSYFACVTMHSRFRGLVKVLLFKCFYPVDNFTERCPVFVPHMDAQMTGWKMSAKKETYKFHHHKNHQFTIPNPSVLKKRDGFSPGKQSFLVKNILGNGICLSKIHWKKKLKKGKTEPYLGTDRLSEWKLFFSGGIKSEP